MKRIGSTDNLTPPGKSATDLTSDFLLTYSVIPVMSQSKSDVASTSESSVTGIKSRPKTAIELARPELSPRKGSPKVDLPKTAEGMFIRKKTRPKTAVELSRPGCDRVQQLETESHCKHTLESHLPLKKKKPPPWQQKLDGQTSPCLVTPGYVMSRSKSKVSMYIKTNSFFDPQHDPNKSIKQPDIQRDDLVSDLQQQIDDLNLFLEEERLNHRETRRKGRDQLKDRLSELQDEHGNSMRMVIQQYEDELKKMQQQQREVLQQQTHAAETNTAKQMAEIEFLHSAFESYKSRLQNEIREKSEKKEKEQLVEFEKKLEETINEVKAVMLSECAAEKSVLGREHAREKERAHKEHKKEKDALFYRFTNAATDMKRLQEVEAKMKVTESELDRLKSQYDLVCTELSECCRNLTDTKVELMNLQQNFNNKVNAVDESYQVQIQDLMTQNTELRRLYVQKCGQLFDEKGLNELKRIDSLTKAKHTMKTLIKARARANISIAATDMRLENILRVPKERPASAPGTNWEDRGARLSAGEAKAVEKSERKFANNWGSRPQTTEGRVGSGEGT